MCDRSGGCSNGITCRLVLRNTDTGLERVEHYCSAHFLDRVWEIERDDSVAAVDAIRL